MDIGNWLRGLGLERYVPAFRGRRHRRGRAADLSDAHAKELGVSLGDRRRLLKAARSPCTGTTPVASRPRASPPKSAGVSPFGRTAVPAPRAAAADRDVR